MSLRNLISIHHVCCSDAIDIFSYTTIMTKRRVKIFIIGIWGYASAWGISANADWSIDVSKKGCSADDILATRITMRSMSRAVLGDQSIRIQSLHGTRYCATSSLMRPHQVTIFFLPRVVHPVRMLAHHIR